MKFVKGFTTTLTLVASFAMVASSQAARLSRQIQPSDARLKIEIFKDPTVEGQGITKQFMVVSRGATVAEGGEVLLATIVSTGDQDGGGVTVDTLGGTYSIESTRASDFTNPTESWRPNAAVIFQQTRNPSPLVPAGTYSQAIHNYSSSGVTGARASHGCVRTPQSKADALVDLVDQAGKSNTVLYVYGNDFEPNARGEFSFAGTTAQPELTQAQIAQIRQKAQR